jgi:hypothetical protein
LIGVSKGRRVGLRRGKKQCSISTQSDINVAVRFERVFDGPARADEVALIAAYLPELLKEMLDQPETDGE